MDTVGLPGRNGALRHPDDIYAAREILHLSAGEVKRAILMLQGMLEINGPLWSLYIEAKLYVLLGCVLALIGGGRSILSLMIVAVLFCFVVKIGLDLNPGFAAYAAIWLIGSLAYYVWNKKDGYRHRMLMCAILIVVAEFWVVIQDGVKFWIVARDVVIAFLISWFLFKLRVRIPGTSGLAHCSYSLYITHFPVILLAQSLLISTGSSSVWVALCFGFCSAAACAMVAATGSVIEAKKCVVQTRLMILSQVLRSCVCQMLKMLYKFKVASKNEFS